MFKQMILAAAVAGLVLALAGAAGAAVSGIDQLTTAGQSMLFVSVGDLNNTADTQVMNDGTSGYGSVGYLYDLGKYEVTNAQYTVFLKDAAKTTLYSTTWGLYNTQMGNTSNKRTGITQSGSSPSFTYALRANFDYKPVNYVNWNNAAAFCNWLTTGDVNSGYYSMDANGIATPNALSHNDYAKINGLTYFIPAEDEWYKAAYYKGGSKDAGYWDYATQSDTAPTSVTATTTGVGKAGSTTPVTFGNYANYNNTAVWNGSDANGNVTTVGTNGGTGYYGTFDQNGNVWEWTEFIPLVYDRGLRGGAFYFIGVDTLHAGFPVSYYSTGEDILFGFRVSAVVPEPATLCLLALGGLGMVLGRKRK